MGRGKITVGMTTPGIMLTMAENSPEALNVLLEMLEDPNGIIDIILLDIMGIRGTKLYMLNNACCGRDKDIFDRTLTMLVEGVFTQEEIHKNLSLLVATPFIDKEVDPIGTPAYGEGFGPRNAIWDEYCKAQKEAFRLNFAENMERQASETVKKVYKIESSK